MSVAVHLPAESEKILGVESPTAIRPPWEENPYALVSWLDMERFAAEKFCTICQNLAGISGDVLKVSHINPRQSGILRDTLAKLVDDCRKIGLKVSALQVEAFREKLANYDRVNIPSVQISQSLDDIATAISCEMETKLFMRIFPEHEDFYEQDELFGAAVKVSFPSAKEDIKEAGCCFATDRNTATVMHLMRVLEVGLNTLAGTLGVSFDRRNWENVINDCDAAIKKINGPTWGADWKEKQEFYSGAAKDFRYFKDAWRNHAMHHRERYDTEEAKSILVHVKTFMVQLADGGLKE